jgi:hypothetical protein
LLAREELDGYDGIKPDQTESNLCRDLGLAVVLTIIVAALASCFIAIDCTLRLFTSNRAVMPVKSQHGQRFWIARANEIEAL